MSLPPIIEKIWKLSEEVFRPCAPEADRLGIDGPVSRHLRMLADAGFHGLDIPTRYGGLGADDRTRHEYGEVLASACGVTAFTQQQLQTGATFVTAATNEALKAAVLPEIASGRMLCGIAISHLRRRGEAQVRARRVPGGYRISGFAPWITGWGALDAFVLGALVMEGGDHLHAYVPIAGNEAALTPSAPLPLTVMGGSGTVELRIDELFVPDSHVLAVHPMIELEKTDLRCITSHAALPLGCARACARLLRELAVERERQDILEVAITLEHEIEQCRREVFTWNCDRVTAPDYKPNALRARGTAIVLAMRAAQSVVAAVGGRAHFIGSTANRLLREAIFYTTAVQTIDVQSATLEQLVSPFFAR